MSGYVADALLTTCLERRFILDERILNPAHWQNFLKALPHDMKLVEDHLRIEDRVPDARQIDEARHGGKRICCVSESASQKVVKPSSPTQSEGSYSPSRFDSQHGAVANAPRQT
jgi:hypothetical protein